MNNEPIRQLIDTCSALLEEGAVPNHATELSACVTAAEQALERAESAVFGRGAPAVGVLFSRILGSTWCININSDGSLRYSAERMYSAFYDFVVYCCEDMGFARVSTRCPAVNDAVITAVPLQYIQEDEFGNEETLWLPAGTRAVVSSFDMLPDYHAYVRFSFSVEPGVGGDIWISSRDLCGFLPFVFADEENSSDASFPF